MKQRTDSDLPQIVPNQTTDQSGSRAYTHYLLGFCIAVLFLWVGYTIGKYHTIDLLTRGQLGITCQK